MKTLQQCQKAVSQAVARAYDVRMHPHEISAEHESRDVRSFIAKTAGKPHADLNVAAVAALSLSRAARMTGDEALATSVADLIDGGVSLDRQAAAPRGLEALMARHRSVRARTNPLPADLKAKARAAAPRVVRRSGESAIKTAAQVAAEQRAAAPKRIGSGARVVYRRLDDGSEHDVLVGAGTTATRPGGPRPIPASSPLAEALKGATKGTIVSMMIAGRSVELEILEVEARDANR